MLQQFGIFTLVGAAGFLVDAGMLLLANVLGVNIAVHVAPIPAIACGSLAGLLWNFLSSRAFVFRHRARRHAAGAAQAGAE